eukprot:8938622-Heterocapsa_arctica.AAC.1
MCVKVRAFREDFNGYSEDVRIRKSDGLIRENACGRTYVRARPRIKGHPHERFPDPLAASRGARGP